MAIMIDETALLIHLQKLFQPPTKCSTPGCQGPAVNSNLLGLCGSCEAARVRQGKPLY